MKADPKKEAAVMNVIEQWWDAFVKRDIDRIMAFFTPDPDMVAIGTGGDEKCIGLPDLRRILSRAFVQFVDASATIGWHSVSTAGSVALVSADITLTMKTNDQQIIEQLQLTVALEWQGNRWVIIQWHDSVPAAGQKKGQAFAT
jgi:ketosteroid isomerase-like protein